MELNEIIEKLRDDKHYYGDFGKKYRSNSDIWTLFNNPLSLGESQKPNIHFLIGGYFHTAILEPEKLSDYRIIDATSRNTKHYKTESNGEMCLLQHEVTQIELMVEKLLSNNICNDLIRGIDVDYEQPGVTELFGNMWKGKADIVNHDEKLIIDLKTTSDISKFQSSAWRYNYDSQAYIYRELFSYEFIFMVIDKNTHQIGIFDCSPNFYKIGEGKVQKASEAYDLFYNTEGFDPEQYFIQQTLN
jgi:hypothetical protein